MLVLKYSEPTLKAGAARKMMESVLVANVKLALSAAGEGGAKVVKESGVLLVKSDNAAAIPVLARVFGVDRVFQATEVPVDEEKVFAACVQAGKNFPSGSSFAVRAKRAWKHLSPSQKLAAECGSKIYLSIPGRKLRVDLDEPDNEVFVEVRKSCVLVSGKQAKGPGGLPVGCEGKAVCVIDSKNNSILAAWMMAKRGMLPVLLLPASFKQARAEAERLGEWFPGGRLEEHGTDAKGERELLEAACKLGEGIGAVAVVSGAAFAEVSGKGKLQGLVEGLSLPLFMPLIGMDEALFSEFRGKAGF